MIKIKNFWQVNPLKIILLLSKKSEYVGNYMKFFNYDIFKETQYKVKIASLNKNQSETDMPETIAGVDNLDSRPSVPKLVLRRDSVQGATWEKISSVTTASEKRTAAPVTQLLNADSSPAARNEVTSMILNTGNAVTSMLNKLKATFKPVEGETVPAPNGRVENGIQLEKASEKP